MSDPIEVEYEREIAAGRGDNDLAYELSVGLSQYKELYKVD